jgi:hypothetical protein
MDVELLGGQSALAEARLPCGIIGPESAVGEPCEQIGVKSRKYFKNPIDYDQ